MPVPARPRRPARVPARRAHAGVALIEVLVSLLLFSLGILGLVAAQRGALQSSGLNRDRAMAADLANDLITQVQLVSHSTAGWDTTVCDDWKAKVESAGLPGVDSAKLACTVTPQTDSTGTTLSYQVSGTLFWQAPGDIAGGSALEHHYTAVTQEPN